MNYFLCLWHNVAMFFVSQSLISSSPNPPHALLSSWKTLWFIHPHFKRYLYPAESSLTLNLWNEAIISISKWTQPGFKTPHMAPSSKNQQLRFYSIIWARIKKGAESPNIRVKDVQCDIFLSIGQKSTLRNKSSRLLPASSYAWWLGSCWRYITPLRHPPPPLYPCPPFW